MVNLTPRQPLRVTFDGLRCGEGPLTLGQLNIFEWLSRHGEAAQANDATCLRGQLSLPEGTRIADVGSAMGALLARHEGLRTTFRAGREPAQRLAGSGGLVIEVYTVDDRATAPDSAELAAALSARMSPRPWDFRVELPVRMALAVSGDVVKLGMVMVSHMVADAAAMDILGGEFMAALRDPAALLARDQPNQPLDQAIREQAPRERRRARAAMGYWEDQLRRKPQTLYAAPRHAESGVPAAVQLSSPAAALALAHISERTEASRPTIVFAAVCTVLALRTGARDCAFQALSANRFEPLLAEHIESLVQPIPVTVDVGAGSDAASFDEVAKRGMAAVLRSGRHGRYDVFERIALFRRIEYDRGVTFPDDAMFNNLVVHSNAAGGLVPLDEVAAAAEHSTLTVHPTPPAPSLNVVRFDLSQLDDAVQLCFSTVDTGRIPTGEIEAILRAVDRLIVAAAARDLDRAAIEETVGLPPVRRGPGWRLVDRCWVEETEVARLVDDAFAPAIARVFPGAADELVAYVVATDDVPTPVAAHERCMATLPGRPTAMAPTRYVLCAGAPADPADPDAWLRQTVLCAGSGRETEQSGDVRSAA